MFGMGFFEIFLVAVIAIIALGPEKLPKAMIEIAKFMKKFKSGVDDAKATINDELNIEEMKAEANRYRAQIEDVKSSMSVNSVDLDIDYILEDEKDTSKKDKKKKKKEKKEALKNEEKSTTLEEDKTLNSLNEPLPQDEMETTPTTKEETTVNDSSDKFRVNFDEPKKDETNA